MGADPKGSPSRIGFTNQFPVYCNESHRTPIAAEKSAVYRSDSSVPFGQGTHILRSKHSVLSQSKFYFITNRQIDPNIIHNIRTKGVCPPLMTVHYTTCYHPFGGAGVGFGNYQRYVVLRLQGGNIKQLVVEIKDKAVATFAQLRIANAG